MNSVYALGYEGALEERAGRRAVWNRVGHRYNTHYLVRRQARKPSTTKREDDWERDHAVMKLNPDSHKTNCNPQNVLLSDPLMPLLSYLFTPPHPLRLHTTHLPSVLPHRRVRILGRCWVSTVSQLNKTIWKQSGPVNVPAQSDPSFFVAVEKNGLSESRGWRAGRARHTTSIHRLSPYPPTQTRFYRLLSTPHTPTLLSAPFKGEHYIWNRAVCVTVPPRTRYSLSFSLSYFFIYDNTGFSRHLIENIQKMSWMMRVWVISLTHKGQK